MRQTGLLVALAVIVALLGCGGLGLLALAGMSRWGSLLSARTPARSTSGLASDLARRAEADYPGFRVEDLTIRSITVDAVRETAAHVLLTSQAEPGFAMTAFYSAPATASAAAAFVNEDAFFSDPGRFSQPVDSFIAMWVRRHPGVVCEYVIDMGDEATAEHRLLVAGAQRSRAGGLPLGKDTIYRYDWDAEKDAWTLATEQAWAERDTAREKAQEVAADAAADAAEEELLDEDEYVESTDPIPVLVRKTLPGFDYRGAVDIGDGCVYALLRNKKYPRMAIVIDEESLRWTPSMDDGLELLQGKSARGTAFVRDWAKAHPGAVIWVITIDPEYVNDRNAISVAYFGSMESLTATGGVPDKALCRYDPKSGTWTVDK